MAQVRFNFTGSALIPKADTKRPFVKEINKDGRKMLALNFGVKAGSNNSAFVEAFGIAGGTIKTMDSDNNKIEIVWEDRFDEDVVKEVASYRKTVVDLGEEFDGRHEFLSMYDAIEYLRENLPEYKGNIAVTGQMQKQWYQDRYYDKFNLQSVYAVDEERKPRLLLTADIYYNKDSVDKDDWKSDKVIAIDGYVQQYINKDEGTKFVPHRFIFNATKYNEDNEQHQKLLNYKMKYVDNKSKNMQHLLWECVLVNGAEEVEFDESQLTKAQLEQVELGIRKIEDFRPAGSILGERVTEYRLFEPKLTGDFSEGFVDSEMTMSEFEDEVYQPAKDEKLDEVVAKAEKKTAKVEEPEVDDDDLF